MQFEKITVTPVIDNILKHHLEKPKTKIYIPETEEWKSRQITYSQFCCGCRVAAGRPGNEPENLFFTPIIHSPLESSSIITSKPIALLLQSNCSLSGNTPSNHHTYSELYHKATKTTDCLIFTQLLNQLSSASGKKNKTADKPDSE